MTYLEVEGGEDQVFFLITFPTSTEKSTNTFMNCDMKNWRKNVSVCHHKYNIIIAVFCRVLRKNPSLGVLLSIRLYKK